MSDAIDDFGRPARRLPPSTGILTRAYRNARKYTTTRRCTPSRNLPIVLFRYQEESERRPTPVDIALRQPHMTRANGRCAPKEISLPATSSATAHRMITQCRLMRRDDAGLIGTRRASAPRFYDRAKDGFWFREDEASALLRWARFHQVGVGMPASRKRTACYKSCKCRTSELPYEVPARV